jgi:NAD(P)H-quinone oxidoreductase subunit 4
MELAQFPWLTVTILLPITAALAIPFIPDENGRTIRWYALTVGLIDFVLLVIGFSQGYDLNGSGLQMVESYTWVSQLDLKWSVGADGLSMPLILLTGFISTLAILASWPVTLKPRLFYFLMLAMYSGQLGVFAVQDMLLFFFMWELELIPVYLLLSIWGGKKRLYAATKFILYTAGGSLCSFWWPLWPWPSTATPLPSTCVRWRQRIMPLTSSSLCMRAFLIAYAVKLPIFPLHTWLPDAHGEATAPVHMLLAGILLKMGGYAIIRMNL